MPPQLLTQLKKIGRQLILWKAELKLNFGLAIMLGWIWALALVDLWLRLDRSERLVTWIPLLTFLGGTLWLVRGALNFRFTPEAVAATVEKTFPQLDNRLINFIQFAENPGGDAFKSAYIRAEMPQWQNLDFRKMHDVKVHRRSRILLWAAVGLLLLPALFFGQAWAVAVWRTVYPFSTLEQPCLTKILKVQPGNSTVLQGEPFTLGCTVKGFSGHEVKVEIEPSGGKKTLYSLGRIQGSAPQEFSYPMAKVTAGLRYRFLAGDAPNSAWFTLATRPPPALASISMVIIPPSYMQIPRRKVNPRDRNLIVPEGSHLQIAATANSPLKQFKISAGSGEPVQFVSAGKPTEWKGEATVGTGSLLSFMGEDSFGSTFEEKIPVQIQPDKPPGIAILAPAGPATLPPGTRPQIEFSVSDDFGVSEIVLEEVTSTASPEDKGTELKSWKQSGEKECHRIWTCETAPAHTGNNVAYRIVARDNRPGHPNETFSPNVIFQTPTQAEFQKLRKDLEQAAHAALEKMITLQKRNLTDTGSLQETLKAATEAQWTETSERQKEIRTLMHDLLANPLKPLGGLTDTAQKLYVNEMVQAVDALQAIPGAETARKPVLAAEAVTLENKILKQLNFAVSAAGAAEITRSVSGISAILESLLRDQTNALKETRAFAESKAKVGHPLIEAQDRIGGDMATFLSTCKEESAQSAQTDAALGDTLTQMIARAGELKIRADMVVAAERLDQNQASEAVPIEERALTHLKSLQAMLEAIKLKSDVENHDALLKSVEEAKEKIEKLKELSQKMKEAMEQVNGQKNKDTKETDAMSDAVKEMQKNITDALLQVPTDLHIFKDLNVANDLVEDVYSVFQEIEQAAGSDKETPAAVTEMTLAKDESLLPLMGEAAKRLDDVEKWLEEKPDTLKITTEASDKAEMPESGIALAALATSAEDLVGDLLKQAKETEEKANDSATNRSSPDWVAGNGTAEGDMTTFSAKGKSGNMTPNHKEEDGRSNVGRQGMSTGETAAGSGTIGKGDDKIEARRTEDPTQSGKVDLAGEADTKATGGGKLASGQADDLGMSGGVKRMDSMGAGSADGMAVLMAKRADALYAQASMKNVRVDSFKNAAHQLHQSADAIAHGDIQQMKEFRKKAITSLTRAEADLGAGPTGAMDTTGGTGVLNNVIETAPDKAPPKYRDKVADYYKALNGAL